MTTVDDFGDAIRAAGLTPPDAIEPGRFHRFPGIGKSNGNTAGFCKMFPDGMGGIFGDFSRDVTETWQAKRSRPMTLVEREGWRDHVAKARAEAEAERRQAQEGAADRAEKLWASAEPATANPYLTRKGLGTHGVRVVGDVLLVPMHTSGGVLVNVQRIASDGDKRFLGGGRVTGCYHSIGKPGGVICIAEGYATGASIREATGHAVAVAFNAGNLDPVARELRAKYPDATLIFCADDDYRTVGNPGVTKATAAARAVGGLVAIPDFGPERPEGASDFNDLAQHGGVEAVRKSLQRAVAPDVLVDQPDAQNAAVGDPTLRALNLAELLCHEFPPREPILAPWLVTQSISMVYAWRGVGKTHLALAIAFAVASGGVFLTWQAPRARRVLYLDGEMPAPAIQARLRAMVEADEREFDPANPLILTPDAQHGPMPDLATRNGQDAVDTLVATEGVELVIVHNISTLCRDTGPENEEGSWRAPQEWALRQRRAGRSVLFVHHSGKSGAQRGSSKREDTLDVSIALKRPADYQTEEGARFEIHFEKYRNGAGEDAKPIEVRLETDGAGRAVWTWRSVDDSTFDRVVALAAEGLRPGDIAAELGINKSNVSRHLKRARADGLIPKGGA
jgi:putative DNA primase/helicase